MKTTWLSDWWGVGRGKFTSENKWSADGEDMNTIVSSDVSKALKIKKKSKRKNVDESNLDDKYEHLTSKS